MLVLNLILAAVIAALVVTAKRLVLGDEDFSELGLSDKYVVSGVAIGLIAGIICYVTPKLGEGSIILAPLFLAVMIGLLVWLVYWWNVEGGSLKEMIPFILLVFLFCFVMKVPAYAFSTIIGIPFIASLVSVAPLFAGIIAIFLMVYNYLNFLYTEIDDTDSERKRHKSLGWLAVAALALLLTFTLATQVDWAMTGDGLLAAKNSLVAEASDEGAEAGVDADIDSDEDMSTWHFYNSELQNDQDESNDFNFGPNPGNLTASEYDADFRERLRNDPALGAAAMAWADANLGTRYLGEFYESCKGDWAKTINASKEIFRNDPELYNDTLEAFFKMLDSAEVKVTDGNNLDDQMYMNPYTVDGIPDVIVMETPDHTGTFLTYVFTIKGTGVVEVSYRTECGYQPTNVEEIMKITPQDKPSNPDKPDKPSKPDKPDKPSKPDKPDKPSNPKYKKDPSKAPKKNTEPNDDKGPGENTNNPSDPQHSTKDTKDSSSSMTYDEYKKDVESKKETNKTQKTGSDSNKPSTPAPKQDTKVDNNGDKGTGNGGINTPTPTKDKAKEAETGKEIKNSPGEAWGGPSD